MRSLRLAWLTLKSMLTDTPIMAVAVVAILGAVAIPAYQESVRKGRRAEAFRLLAAAQQAQERWRGVNAEYATDLTSAPPTGLGVAASSPSMRCAW